MQALLSPENDTTETLSLNPRIIRFDRRFDYSPCFLYLPPGQNDTVFIDYFPIIDRAQTWPLWRAPRQSHPHVAFRPQPIAGKGIGLVTNRLIQAGELIYTERPLFVSRSALLPYSEHGIFYRSALKGLSVEALMKFFDLHNAYPTACDHVRGILNTNCLRVSIPDPPDSTEYYVGCFATLSRINHDCRPNTKYFFDVTTFEGQIRAMRDIPPDQEITIAYTELSAPRQQRQESLLASRFFECRCRTCCLPPMEQLESDGRRQEAGQLIRQLQDAPFPPPVPLDQLRAALTSAGEEGLTSEYAQILLLGSQVLTVYNQLEEAKQWVQHAKGYFLRIEGETSHNIQTLNKADQVHGIMVGT